MEVDFLILVSILIVFVLLVLTFLYFLYYSGIFLEIEVKTCKPPFKSLEVAYKFAKGPARDCGSIFTEAKSIAPGLRIIGIYYDTLSENLQKPARSIIGLIMNDEGMQVDDETRSLIAHRGFQVATFPGVEHVVLSVFPHNTLVSTVIASSRVIPRLHEYIKDKKLDAYPLMEICDGKDILYACPLSRQEEFFVPEASVESEEDQRTLSEEWSAKEDEFDPDSLIEGSRGDDLPSAEIIDSLGDNGRGMTNGSEASTESFEELQMDS